MNWAILASTGLYAIFDLPAPRSAAYLVLLRIHWRCYLIWSRVPTTLMKSAVGSPSPLWRNVYQVCFRVPDDSIYDGKQINYCCCSPASVAGLFTLAGFYQMAVWALGKHRAYKKDFKDYPRGRKAIIPFVLWAVAVVKGPLVVSSFWQCAPAYSRRFTNAQKRN